MQGKNNHWYIVLLTLLTTFSTTAQQDSTGYFSAREIYDRAKAFYFDEEYDKAFDEYQKVNYNDTAYFDSRSMALHCASVQNKYDTVIKLCREVLAVEKKNPNRQAFMNSLGHAMVQKEKYERAVRYFDKSLKEFPANYLFHYNRGSALYELERYDEAVEALQTSIRYNPRYYASHLKLGAICAESGDLSKAALCFNMALFLNAAGDGSIHLISTLEALYGGNISKEIPKVKYREDEDFDELDLLIKNKVAENSKYKVKMKLQYDFVKHNHLLLEKIEYDPESNGFWNQNYVRVFKEFFNRGDFANFIYFECLSVDNEKTRSLITKNKSKIAAFVEWGGKHFTESMNVRTVWNGSEYVENTLNHQGGFGFNEDVLITEDGTPKGPFIGYDDDGGVESEGQFSDAGKVDGVWKYYDKNGNLETEATFTDGELKGKRTAYYSNGARQQVIMVKNNSIDGDMLRFYTTNQPSSKVPFNEDGDEEGPAEYYFRVGGVSHKVNYADGKLDGDFEEYHLDGSLRIKSTYEAGKQVGEHRSYFPNGELEVEGQYENGLAVGHWKYMYDNGQLESEGDFKAGLRVGDWNTYSKNGKLSEKANYGETGKKAGLYKEYDLDGNLIIELEYKGDEIVSYKTYNKEGKILSQKEKKKKELVFENYHNNGELKATGKFYKGERIGVWKFYNQYGVPTTELNYLEGGKLDGECKWYFANGQVETIKHYTDGVIDGYFVDFYRNGQIYKEGWFRDGDAVGEWKYYFSDGTRKVTEYFLEGETHGDVVHFDENGRKYEITQYFYGTYTGALLFDSTGKAMGTYQLEDGAALLKFRDMNGKQINQRPYKGAMLHGETIEYYPDGSIESKGQVVEGDYEGDWKWYYEDGKVQTEGSYIYGYRDGKWTWYHENGKVRVSSMYEDGNLTGTETRYYENGVREAERSYRMDERHGESSYYDPSGKLQYIRYYEDGLMLGYAYLGKDGKPVEMIPFNNQNGKMEAFFQSGVKSYESEYKDGFNNGKTVYYHANGKPSDERVYLNNQLHGTSTEYYASGKVRISEEYEYGLLQGAVTEYYANGKVKSVKHYILNELYGWAESYDERGTLKKREYYYNGRKIK